MKTLTFDLPNGVTLWMRHRSTSHLNVVFVITSGLRQIPTHAGEYHVDQIVNPDDEPNRVYFGNAFAEVGATQAQEIMAFVGGRA